MKWAYQCYYCGKEYVKIAAAYKHTCRHQPKGMPLHMLPVFLIVCKGV